MNPQEWDNRRRARRDINCKLQSNAADVDVASRTDHIHDAPAPVLRITSYYSLILV